jgi:hypothetical protein
VEKERFLLEMTAYIHLNPEKLNLTKDAKAYPYSSYQLYMFDDQAQKKDLDSLNMAIKEALSLLGDKTYPEFVQSICQEDRVFIQKKLSRGGILGSEEFIKQVRDEVQVYQAQGAAKKYEVTDKKSYKLFLIYGSLFLVLLVGTGLVYVFFVNTAQTNLRTQIAKATALPKKEDWSTLEWQIKLTPIKGGNVSIDVLSFKDNMFVSTKLNSLGFPNSGFSQSLDDDGKIIWKTMQTGPQGIATWKGQIFGDTMKGILTLREQGKDPQDFSFISTE